MPMPTQPPVPGISFPGSMAQQQLEQIQLLPGTDPQTRAIIMAALNPKLLQQSAEEEEEKKRERMKKKKKLEPLTVESLLNIPLPATESPEKKKEKVEENIEDTMGSAANEEMVITEQEVVMEQDAEEVSEQMEIDAEGQPTKVYRFAWEDNSNADRMSDVTVSSVHTSDLSSFEDSCEEAEEEEQVEEVEEEQEKVASEGEASVDEAAGGKS